MHRTVAFVSFLLLAGIGAVLAGEPQRNPPWETITIDSPLGPQRFRVQLATKWTQQEKGLMFRKQMPADEGMLFDFHRPQMMSFWMKNTYIPLDILFIRDDGTISTISADAEPLSLKSIRSAEPVRAVLEINGGRAAALQIREGAKIHSTIFQSGH